MTQQTLFPCVNYRLGGQRPLPVSGDYLTLLMDVVKRTDPGLTIDITSAGQVPQGTPGPRIGETARHDVDHTGHAHTSDLVLVRDGKPIKPKEDQALYAKFLQNAAASGFTGFGHYEWGVHIGGGSKAAWGPTTGKGSLNPVFEKAINDGWAGLWAEGTAPSTPSGPQPDANQITPSRPTCGGFLFHKPHCESSSRNPR